MANKVISYVKLCVALLLIAKGFLHFTSDQPYEFLLSESEWLATVFGLTMVVFGMAALVPNKLLSTGNWIYVFIIPGVILILHSAAGYIQAGSVIEQFIEHSLQMALPFLLIFVAKARNFNWTRFYYLVAILVALTFVGHGIYALGVHYVPGNFIEMTSRSLGISKDASVDFLFVIGWLDILFAFLSFVPIIRRYVIWYLIIWGFLTSVARTFYVIGDGFTTHLILVNIPNTIYRLPHALIPVLMLALARMLDLKGKKKEALSHQEV